MIYYKKYYKMIKFKFLKNLVKECLIKLKLLITKNLDKKFNKNDKNNQGILINHKWKFNHKNLNQIK